LGVRADPDHDQNQIRGGGEVGFAGHGQPAGVVVDGLDGDLVDQLHPVAAQLLAQQPAQLDIHGGHDRRRLLNHGDLEAAGTEGLGHLQTDEQRHQDGLGGRGEADEIVAGRGVCHGAPLQRHWRTTATMPPGPASAE
jgi:hypothetical protein